MRLAWLGIVFVTLHIVTNGSPATISYAQEAESLNDINGTPRTFTAPINDKDRFNKAVKALKIKVPNMAGGDSEAILTAVEIPELGIIMATGIFTDEDAQRLISDGFEEPNSIEVNLFANTDCVGAESLLPAPSGTKFVPPSICRVVKSPENVPSGSKVWIIDSGIDEDVVNSGLLRISERIDCTTSTVDTCSVVTQLTDGPGHGTIVAGIIGGKRSNRLGIVGVSPDVPLVIVKAFRGNSAKLFGPPYLALKYVKENAAPGDILNISWGAAFLEVAKKRGQFDNLGDMDKILFDIADRQIRVVIAAGNAQDEDSGGWVQSYFPANTSNYDSTKLSDNPNFSDAAKRNQGHGFLRSVSAAKSNYEVAGTGTCAGVVNGWCDELWRGGSFGATMAEPAVNVHVLWKSGKGTNPKRNICSGTSLAAPVLAGLLARMTAVEEMPGKVPFGWTKVKDVPIKSGLIAGTDLVGFLDPGIPAGLGTDFPTCGN
jgi:subtilisin family serine protease